MPHPRAAVATATEAAAKSDPMTDAEATDMAAGTLSSFAKVAPPTQGTPLCCYPAHDESAAQSLR